MAISTKRRRKLGLTIHTCESQGMMNCEPCMRWQTELWDAINRYVVACGGDPARHVHGNVSRMNAVADVNDAVQRAASKDLVR